jgi:hypothetical protein
VSVCLEGPVCIRTDYQQCSASTSSATACRLLPLLPLLLLRRHEHRDVRSFPFQNARRTWTLSLVPIAVTTPYLFRSLPPDVRHSFLACIEPFLLLDLRTFRPILARYRPVIHRPGSDSQSVLSLSVLQL